MAYQLNEFLVDLLKYQQSGDLSVSGPDVWGQNNLINIKTPLTEQITGLAKSLEEDTGKIWQFYVGSPGGGKSHLVGLLYKQLISQGWSWKAIDQSENKTSYAYKWFRPNNEGKYSDLWFIQDASAVPNAFDPDADEGRELAKTLNEAWEKGISLIVCVNRGILEKVLTTCIEDSTKEWFRAIRWLADAKKECEEDVFLGEITLRNQKKVSVRRSIMDSLNLFHGEESSPAQQILIKISEDKNWKICNSCSLSNICPFFQNKKSLSDPIWREKFVNVIRNAENLSGHMVVFREYLALVSAIFSGSSYDSNSNPCIWVRDQYEINNYISLISKRFYMQLFSSYSPAGLDDDSGYQKHQISVFKDAYSELLSGSEGGQLIQSFLDNYKILSKDLGLERLIGRKGFLTFQDPLRGKLDYKFLLDHSLDFDGSVIENLKNIGGDNSLEKTVYGLWVDIIKNVDKSDSENSNKYIQILQRWASSFILRFYGFYFDKTVFYGQLKNYRELLDSLPRNNIGTVSIEKKQLIKKKEARLNEIIEQTGKLNFDKAGVRLSRNLIISGPAINELSKINILINKNKPPYLRIPCGFGKTDDIKNKEPQIYLSGFLFCWLEYAYDNGILVSSIPSEVIDSLLQARSRAISQSNYSRNTNKLVLEIRDSSNQCVVMEAEENYVISTK